MTKVFEELQKATNDPEIRNSENLTKDMIQNGCAYQIACSLVEIETTLKEINRTLSRLK